MAKPKGMEVPTPKLGKRNIYSWITPFVKHHLAELLGNDERRELIEVLDPIY